jgi:iron complex outermembrane receptor protein
MSNARGHREIPGHSAAPGAGQCVRHAGGLNSPKQDVKAWGWSLFWRPSRCRADAAFDHRLSGDESSSPIDFDASALVDVDVPAFYRNNQTSQEFQALYSSGKFNGMVGFYYLDATR